MTNNINTETQGYSELLGNEFNPSTFNRWKSFNTQVQHSPQQIDNTVNEINSLEMGEGLPTRATTRIIINSTQLLQYTIDSHYDLLEGVIPLMDSGIEELSDGYILYLGKNHVDRVYKEELQYSDINDSLDVLTNAYNRYRESKIELPLEGIQFSEVSLESITDEDILQITNVNKPFSWDIQDTVAIIEDSNSTLVACRHNNRIIASGLAYTENYSIRLQDDTQKELTMTELTEATVLPEFRQLGIYSRLVHSLKFSLINKGLIPNIIYTETNTSSPAMTRICYRQGRNIYGLTQKDLISTPRLLRQHVTIIEPDGSEHFRNFVVTYQNRQEILRMLEL